MRAEAQTKKQGTTQEKGGDAGKLGMEVIANGRDIDEYNRRGTNDTTRLMKRAISTIMKSTSIPTNRSVSRPESSIKITGADEVIVYVGNDIYENYNNRGWSSLHGMTPGITAAGASFYYNCGTRGTTVRGGYGWWYNPNGTTVRGGTVGTVSGARYWFDPGTLAVGMILYYGSW